MISSDQVPPGQDWILRRLADLERQVRELQAGRRLEAATIGAGGITVKGGAVRIVQDGQLAAEYANGDQALGIGGFIYQGDPVHGIVIKRPGTDIFSFIAYSEDAGDPGFWAHFDLGGHVVVSDDAVSGEGLARPWLPIPFVPHSLTAMTDTSVSATFEGKLSARYQRQHPQLLAKVLVRTSDGTTAGEIRLIKVSTGEQIGSTVTVAAGDFGLKTIGPATCPGNFGEEMELELQVRRTAGAGSVGVRMFGAWGRQS